MLVLGYKPACCKLWGLVAMSLLDDEFYIIAAAFSFFKYIYILIVRHIFCLSPHNCSFILEINAHILPENTVS